MFLVSRPRKRSDATEAQARERVRKAEDNLGNVLRISSRYWRPTYTKEDGTIVRGHWVHAPNSGPISTDGTREETGKDLSPGEQTSKGDQNKDVNDPILVTEQASIKQQSDRLTLAALWDVTHSRLDLYHEIVTGQARRSFRSAQMAMWIGFLMLIGFAVLATQAKTTTGAISIGSLGAVGAAFAAFIGRTFVRSQESAANHLRAYFDQPLELSRYLAAERLLADDSRLTDDQHAATFSTLVQSISTAGHPVNEGGASAKNTRRRNNGR